MKSLSVIRMFSEYSFGISTLFLKFRPMVGSTSFRSSSSPLVSLFSLSFFIINFLVWVSPTPTPWTKLFINVSVDGAGLKLPGDMSNGRSVAVQSDNEFLPLACFPAAMFTCRMLCVSFSSACRPCIHYRTQVFVVPFFYLTLF